MMPGSSSLVGQDQLLSRLSAALRRAEGDEVELSVRTVAAGYSRFAGSEITQASIVRETETRVRVARGKRMAAARTDSLDPERLADAAARAATLAARAPEIAEWPGFSRVGTGGERALVGPDRAYDEATDASGRLPQDRADRLRRAFDVAGARGLVAAGLAATSAGEQAIVTTGGTVAYQRSTVARLELTALDPMPGGAGASGFAGDVRVDGARLDFEALAERATADAVRARHPIEMPPGAYDVILEPRALGEVLEWMAFASLGSQGTEDGTGFLAGRAGQRITGPAVTLVDDALDPDPLMLPSAFDAEGTPKARVVLIDGGVARTPVLDRLSARRAGAASTGHAAPVEDDGATGSLPVHLTFAAGRDRVEDLLRRVERGLWVTRFHYVNGLADPRRALMTGMTRDGLYLIENGKLGRPVRNMRWTQPILEAFERIDGVTAERRAVPRSYSGAGATLAPTILVRQFQFTGQSR